MKLWRHWWHKAKKHFSKVTRRSLEEDVNLSFKKHNIPNQFVLHESHPLAHLMEMCIFDEERINKFLSNNGVDKSDIDKSIKLLKKIYVHHHRHQ